MKYKIVTLLVIVFCFTKTYSQTKTDSTQMWELTMVDGNKFQGFIIHESQTHIVFKTFAYGEIDLPNALIKSRLKLGKSTTPEKKTAFKQAINTAVVADSNALWRIVTDEGFDFTGTIVNKTDLQIELKTDKFGVMKIDRRTIKSMDIINKDQIVHGEVWFENPQGSRYFYTPNGYGLRKGEGYYQNVWVLFNQASYGFNKYFTMGLGTIPTFLFGADFLPIWITPKLSFPVVDNVFNIGAGSFSGFIAGEQAGFGLVYGVATYGSRDRNFNMGAGYFYADGEWAKNPTISISTMIRTGKKGYFLSENFIINTSEQTIVLASLGGRTIWPRLSLDYGLVFPLGLDNEGFLAIPWLGFVMPFGNTSGTTY